MYWMIEHVNIKILTVGTKIKGKLSVCVCVCVSCRVQVLKDS